MQDYVKQNKAAWANTYDFWVKECGTPAERAKEDRKDPYKMLRRHGKYFTSFEGRKIANICGSCGKKAVPLALLGADVTIFDLSEGNRKYACEVAQAAGTHIDFIVGDVLQIDLNQFGGEFDVVFMEGGVLHYFHDLKQFMDIMFALLKMNGTLICSDFHPFQKIYDVLEFERPTMSYFSTDIIEGEMAHARFYPDQIRKTFPPCRYRRYNISEIINSVLDSGFTITRFDELPAWNSQTMPGEFVLLAQKMKQ